MKKYILLSIILLMICGAKAQQWGLYTLYSVTGTNKAFLIDTNNTIYKTWTFGATKQTSFTSYLIPGDTLVRTINYTGNLIIDHTISGEVQKVDWNNNVIWDFIYSTDSTVLHHDIHPLPNGNILMIAMDVKTASEGTLAGASVSMVRHSDKIIEVHPTGPTTGTIVWEWKLWDHLCQDYNPTKNNYVQSISQNPQLININYSNSIDFIHTNGIDYNAALDQIAFSSFEFSEIFVIDHSTTTTEAAGHTGGNSGYGGDIIYRWGNPTAYETNGQIDFNVVHNAHWVSSDDPYYPNYLCGFNNHGGSGGNSCVDIFCPPYDGYNYLKTQGQAYAPATYAWRYTANCQTLGEGSSQQLPNGNSLVCLTYCSSILEIDHNGTPLWSFHPAGWSSNALRYSECYVRGPVAFDSASSLDVVSGTPITLYSHATSVTENNPAYTYSWTSVPPGFTSSLQNPTLLPMSTATYIVTITDTTLGCSDTASVTVQVVVTGIKEQSGQKNEAVIYPNPTDGIINIKGAGEQNLEITLRNVYGETILNISDSPILDLSGFAKGIYYLTVRSGKTKMLNYKIVKSE
ncbi:MAG: aryl-sulfate sulfotransferase [Bacteroidetes bacterium]|nr:aryl-sulfate sulfotransferase [Bacteroidota bacterium]